MNMPHATPTEGTDYSKRLGLTQATEMKVHFPIATGTPAVRKIPIRAGVARWYTMPMIASGDGTMSLRMRLRLLIDDLSEEKLQEVEIYIEALNDPVLMSMITAPYDDEPLTDEEREAVEEGRKEAAEGRLISNEELWQSLGL